MERRLAEFRARKKVQSEATRPADLQPERTDTSRESRSGCDPAGRVQSPAPVAAEALLLDSDSGSGSGHWLQRRALAHLTLLKLLLWLVLLGLFAELEFGLPFFLISLFFWLYEGCRSPKPRQAGEMSAYSVFNPDCQPILGTLTAEQLEGEMGYRAAARR